MHRQGLTAARPPWCLAAWPASTAASLASSVFLPNQPPSLRPFSWAASVTSLSSFLFLWLCAAHASVQPVSSDIALLSITSTLHHLYPAQLSHLNLPVLVALHHTDTLLAYQHGIWHCTAYLLSCLWLCAQRPLIQVPF